MNFRVLEQRGLENARSPFRVVEDDGQEVEWVNRFLDQERVRSVAETTLRSYAYDLLNFLRWWVEVSQTTAINEKAESTLLDYIRFQTNRQPQPAGATINRRVGIAERALRLAFPHTQTSFVPGFQYGYWRPLPLGIGRPLPALSRLHVRLRRSARIDHLRSPRVTHTKEHDLPVGKEKSDIIHAEGVRFAVASSPQRGPWKAVSRQEFIGRTCGQNRSSHREIAAWQAAVADQ